MAETALFVSAALLFMLGTIQIGVVGYLQVTSDSAAYYDSRAHVLGVASGSPEQATYTKFPQIPIPDMTAAIVPAPTPSIPVDYGYNDPNPAVQTASATQRHGGASMLQPAEELVTVSVNGIAHILGNALGTNAEIAEPLWQECGTHFDVANVGCSLTNPPSDSQDNYFTQGENTPPYMVGYNYMQECNLSPPWGVNTTAFPQASMTYPPLNNPNYTVPVPGPSPAWQGPCSNGSNNGNSYIGYISEGTAEFLDTTNWSDTGPGSGSGQTGAGIEGTCDQGGPAAEASPSDSGQGQNVFEAVAYHQRTYSAIAQFLQSHPYLWQLELYSQLYDTSFNDDNNFVVYYNMPNHEQPLVSQYNFTYSGQQLGTGILPGQIAIPEPLATGTASPTYQNWEGFDDAQNGPGVTNSTTGTQDYYNSLVQTVYSWDKVVAGGDPVNDPTYNNPTLPDANCS
jgi:hypothetical protein